MASRDGKKKTVDGANDLDIATTLQTMTESLVSLQRQMTDVNSAIDSFNTRLDDKLEGLTSTVADNVRSTLEPQLDTLRESSRMSTVDCNMLRQVWIPYFAEMQRIRSCQMYQLSCLEYHTKRTKI